MSDVLSALGSVLIGTSRSIANLIPGCAIEEHLVDTVVVTDHPVQQGAPISDHKFTRPKEVTLRWGWSNSLQLQSTAGIASLLSTDFTASDLISESYAKEVYEQLLGLQSGNVVFDISTGKRLYHNMVMTSLEVTTDATTEYALIVVATCREVIITTTQETTISASASNQANASQTQETADTGTKTGAEVSTDNKSILKELRNSLFGGSS